MSKDQENARRQAFSRKVFWKVTELEQQMYEERCERFSEMEAKLRMLNKQTSEMIAAAKAAGRFAGHLSIPQVGPPYSSYPGAFSLQPLGQTSLFQAALQYLEHWKQANPGSVPSVESQLRCLADAEELATPSADFPKSEFVYLVSESFELWKQNPEPSL